MNPYKYGSYGMNGTLRWPYNNMQKEFRPYEHVGVNANQSRVGHLKYWFIGVFFSPDRSFLFSWPQLRYNKGLDTESSSGSQEVG